MREAHEVKLIYGNGGETFTPGNRDVVTIQILYQNYGGLGLRLTYEDASIVEIDYHGDYRVWWKTSKKPCS